MTSVSDTRCAREAADTWRRALCLLYSTQAPVVRLGAILHWHAVVGALGVAAAAEHDPAFVAHGYFYRPHTLAPQEAELDADRREAEAGAAQWLLYPVVRSGDGEALASRGFVELPWLVESEFVVEDDVERDLRRLLGRSRLQERHRLIRRAEESYIWQAAIGSAIDDQTLVSFDRLHQLNLAKYGHSRNHFGLPILRMIAASPLRDRMCVFLHRRHSDGRAVQGVLAVTDRESGVMDVLVQGIDHAAVPRSQNLYVAAVHRMYLWGVARGVRCFNLGRGASLTKLNLGANRFHVVNNHMSAVREAADGVVPEPLATLQAAARSSIGGEVADLATMVEHRGLSGQVVLPKEVQWAR